MTISSPSNQTVKELVRLRSRRHRDDQRRFIIEGERPVLMAVAAGVPLEQLVISPELGGSRIVADVPTLEMGEAPFRKVSIRQNPDGVMAVAPHLPVDFDRLDVRADPLILVVESIEKPGNLGAMLRTADAVGAAAVVVCDPTTDLHNPNVVRASQGALFTVPVAVGSTPEVAGWLTHHDIPLFATTPSADDLIWDADLTGRAAVAIGSEAHGLTSGLIQAARQQIRIPMQGSVDSLNASVAAAVVVYEAARQRRQA